MILNLTLFLFLTIVKIFTYGYRYIENKICILHIDGLFEMFICCPMMSGLPRLRNDLNIEYLEFKAKR